ncbi:MAG: single-stranded-DNA-specific exonuclease RecJ [Pseudophaeobacter sp. bin_em_oilr2.035]|uniref:Single-stranded-DNA-specific exonuclease RecJ n=1 Tax=Phaeobacter gallaeciensis TaxID=60890 RepID=A0ABD4X8K0_9RHOB|nr:single-stranded-DNA-specific exonuclease RecJ [Phaeobacter gallaeciensis]MDF1770809.1 single-stranded-DNA-specific exonuclease RecJ [Pseudophaeobacter sp. bin_em_oilr2.035]MDE4144510.1 single-stranded-DNA-specific exonuclease RecJ [Phaeobacter gallaeciensis]MDE4157449.1 single-stranded-DNA-specific exonuclease RecJ [Phaeobacter gallaeciensis]MDE4161636.1 single-stranded-DNA-specific exonuclease RecJ [Phaeobacter gallaeciensis]MDE4165858.1 single-stranded-DNA-specific exonuclease RecJ [Phaeo
MSFLGVEQSLTGRRWLGPGIDLERAAEAMAQQTGLPAAVCQVLARRGVPAHEATGFLTPALKDLLPDPRRMKDMETAAARFLEAVEQRQRIAIFADYDVDGGSSAALLLVWLRAMGQDATLYIPDRIDEGYGPNDAAMSALARDHDLIVCVDCGTLSHGPIAAAKGADVIVLDHHLGGETLPDCVAVVNPNRQDEDGDLGYFCAAGVVFLMLVEVRRQAREKGLGTGPDLMALLDLVALATVADVAPLIGANRALVRQGLKVMAARKRVGLVALADVSRMDSAPSTYHLGFLLGPRVNAGGRIGKADLGARLLASDNPHEAAALAERLDQLNTERRDIENAVRAAALEQAEARGLDAPLVWAAGEGWHPGVVGIVASRLKEAAGRPAVVIGLDGDEGKGSGRSVSGIDLGAAIQRLANEGQLIKGGGHKMAAGLTVARDRLEEAMARLGDLLAKQGAGDLGPADVKLDGMLMPGAASINLIEQIEQAGPFGAGAPAPRYAFPDLEVRFAKRVGESHLKLSLSDGLSSGIDAICFGAFDTDLGPRLLDHGGARFHFAGRLEINTWGGRQSPQLRLEDAAPAS